MKRIIALTGLLVCMAFSQAAQPGDRYAVELPRDIPVIAEVDVVVAGGTSGGVAAAIKAAHAGAKVFLVAPRPYLGEDLCGTYRLWLEPGEEPNTPLARRVFAKTPIPPAIGKGIPFSYEADSPSASVHKDTQPLSLLSDGKWESAVSQSVQYNNDVNLTIDLKQTQQVQKVHLMAYQRPSEFVVQSVALSSSIDGQQWQQVAAVDNDKINLGGFENPAMAITVPAVTVARYLKVFVRKAPDAARILLGEIVIETDETAASAEACDSAIIAVRPMQVKRELEQALIESGADFLYSCYATDLLRDSKGELAGIVIANRTGRQAVIAKVIIDATPRAAVTRLAGAAFEPYPAGAHTFSRVVVGGLPCTGAGVEVQKGPSPIIVIGQTGKRYEAIEYSLAIHMRDGSFGSFAQAEQVARDKTWSTGQVDASETLFQVPPDSMNGRRSVQGPRRGVSAIDLDAFRPAGIDRLYVLGGCADISRPAAERLLQPLAFIEAGERIGKAAANEARQRSKPEGVHLPAVQAAAIIDGQVREIPTASHPRSAQFASVPSKQRALPVIGQYDVVVIGGGTGGAPAGIGAGRQGAKTLVVEYLHGLGGVGTMGLIGNYYYGNRVGFTHEVDLGIASFGKETINRGGGWNVEWKIEWYRQQLRKAGVDVWLGSLGAGALTGNDKVTGVVVVTPEGRSIVLAKVVIDATGNADIAAAAGAPCVSINGSHIAVQGTGLPPRELDANYTNTDYTFVDETDVFDIWRVFVVAKGKFPNAYDLGQLIDTRERRRIIGDFTLSPLDMANHRTFPDTIVIAKSNFDTHGFIVHPAFMIKPPDRTEIAVNVPYRCLVPQNLDRILVTGLGVSAHRDAMPVIRMQADIQNQGYAAGVAAAWIAKAGISTRALDVKALQQHLVDKGNLPESVLTAADSYPLPVETVAAAVERAVNDFDGLEIILAQPQTSVPLLRKACESAASNDAKLTYAHILGMLGDPTGIETLLQKVQAMAWDKGWNFTGMGQYGASQSTLDSLIIALGRTGDKRALGPIIAKVQQLNPQSEFSHHRAVAIALESLADSAAAKPLAELLAKPGMTGHAVAKIQEALRASPPSETDTSTRNRALRELILARALYRCGDYQGVGEKILKQYANDLHGHYARHANAILTEK